MVTMHCEVVQHGHVLHAGQRSLEPVLMQGQRLHSFRISPVSRELALQEVLVKQYCSKARKLFAKLARDLAGELVVVKKQILQRSEAANARRNRSTEPIVMQSQRNYAAHLPNFRRNPASELVTR